MSDTLQHDLDKCRRAAADKLAALESQIPYQKASIQVLNGDLRTLFVVRGFREEEASRPLLRPISSDPLVNRIFEAGKPYCIADTSCEEDWQRQEETLDVKSWIGAPILHDEKRVGFLTLDFCERQPHIETHFETVSAFATQVAPLLSHASLLDGHRRLARDMTIVTEIVKIIGEKLDTKKLLDEIVRQVAERLDCTHCTIFFPKKRDGKLLLVPQHAGGSEETRTRTFNADEGLAGWVFKNGKTAIVSDAAQDSRFAPARVQRMSGGRSMLVAPIKVGDQTIGVISADQDVPGWFSQSDASLLDALGQQAGIAIQRSLAFELLQDIATRILALRHEDEILQEVVRGAIDLVNATTGVIYLLDASGKNISNEYHPPEFNHPRPRLDNPRGVTSTVIRTAEPVRVPNVRSASHVDTNLSLHGTYASMIAVPLKTRDGVIGVFFVDDADEHRFTDTEESLLVILASHAAIAIHTARLLKDLTVQIRRHEELEKHMERLHGIVTEQETNLVDRVLDLVGEGIRAMFGDDVSPTINLLVPGTCDFEPPRAYGPLRDHLREPPRSDGGTGQYVLARKEPLYLSDVTSPKPGVPTIRNASVALGVKSFAAIPLMQNNQVLGVLFVNSQRPVPFDESQRLFLESFAGQAAKAIENYRLPDAVTALREKALEFFKNAGRGSARIVGSLQLSLPEPVRVAAAGVANLHDVSGLEQLLQPGQVGYFVYTGELPGGTVEALDDLRKRRNPVVPLSEDVMTAAIVDGTAEGVLIELEHDYRSSENLFDARNALIDKRFLFGRRQLLADVGAALARGEHILIFGLRKSGKTSFLNILRQHLSKHPVSSVDLQRYDRRHEDWPPLLFKYIVSSFDTWGRAAFGKDWPGQTSVGPTTVSEFQDALHERREWQTNRGRTERLVIVLDEIERIFQRNLGADEAHQFVRAAGALRSLGQIAPIPFVSIIAADLRWDVNQTNRIEGGANALGTAGTNPFFEFFRQIPLPLLTRHSTGDMVNSIGRAMGIKSVSKDFVDGLFQHTGGHPFLSRLVSAAAYRTRRGEVLNESSLRAGLREIEEVNVPGFFFEENFWADLRGDERSLLLNHTRREPTGSTPPVAASPDKAALTALGLLKKDQIPIGLFETWLRQVKLDHENPVV